MRQADTEKQISYVDYPGEINMEVARPYEGTPVLSDFDRVYQFLDGKESRTVEMVRLRGPSANYIREGIPAGSNPPANG